MTSPRSRGLTASKRSSSINGWKIMSTPINRAVLLFLLIALAGTNAWAQSCEATPTKHVYVAFDGCANSEPGLEFDVYVGGERITVKKKTKEDDYWKGATSDTFTIGKRFLRIPIDATPSALAKCDAPARGHRDGACVALYRVKCEPVWVVDVALVPLNQAPSLSYERRGTRQTIRACDRDD